MHSYYVILVRFFRIFVDINILFVMYIQEKCIIEKPANIFEISFFKLLKYGSDSISFHERM